jgi:uncharacterized protein YjlB
MSYPKELGIFHFEDDGRFPNSRWPVLLYHLGIPRGEDETANSHAARIESIFGRHRWKPDWRDGIFDYHHYHSTAHETLGVFSGTARLIIGGPSGRKIEVQAGDVLVLPAGTGHCAVEQSSDFKVVGAYPLGQQWDIMRGNADERPDVLTHISSVPRPEDDPIGKRLLDLWPLA